ncbi:MAG TPA: hypothetical protein VJ276_18425 [Thermoanaerobaculia bacterium]|nr:hypothetical protein [Thermoanaerobaculia bacterium]
MAIIFGAAVVLIVLEQVFPGRHLPNSPSWFLRAALLNAAQLGVVILAGYTWNRWFTAWSLIHIAGKMPPPVEGLIAWFIGTFVFYWWHRAKASERFPLASPSSGASQSGTNRGDHFVL